MSPQVSDAVAQILTFFKTHKKNEPIDVVSLGYPDILADMTELTTKYKLEGLEAHPEGEGIAAYHGRSGITIPTAESFFSAFGATLHIIDVKKWRGNEMVLDLNLPLEQQPYPAGVPAQFDLIVDCGTLEHCFNIGQAIANLKALCKVDGKVVHFNPLWMPNHGFYNLSPTFYHDFYMANGFSIDHMSAWERKDNGNLDHMLMVPKTQRFNYKAENISNMVVATKIEDTVLEWPTQTKYKNMTTMGTKDNG